MQLNYHNPTSHLHFPYKLIELIKEGAVVTDRNLQPIYLNTKAQEISQKLGTKNYLDNLSAFIANLESLLIKKNRCDRREFIVDYQIANEQTIRIRVNYLIDEAVNEVNEENVVFIQDYRPGFLIFIEDRSAILQEELRIEQQKYGLSDRETEISGLLLQSHTYQDIAKRLQISLNTVKFHVKNINGKKRNFSAPESYCFAF